MQLRRPPAPEGLAQAKFSLCTITHSQVPDSDLSFAVLGDIHGNNDSFQTAIRDLHSINPAMDALILNGDTVDQGIMKQYDVINKTLLKNKALLPKSMIKNIGNHEFFNYNIEINSPEDVQLFINHYLLQSRPITTLGEKLK